MGNVHGTLQRTNNRTDEPLKRRWRGWLKYRQKMSIQDYHQAGENDALIDFKAQRTEYTIVYLL